MTASTRPLASVALLTWGTLACSAPEPEQLPPYGEVVLSVDTDASVPYMVGRLRLDTFDETGRWLESRDVARPDPSDWPASFSVYTKDESRPHRVLVRARAYLEGRSREYQGERFKDATPYVEPRAASSLPELCQDLPELALGKDVTLRRGSRPLTTFVPDDSPDPDCWSPLAGGVAAARLEVAQAGKYRIEVIRVSPVNADPNLFIRRDCRDALSQLACNDDINRDQFAYDYRSRLELELEPGSYTVMSGSPLPAPSDVTLRADLAANWQEEPALRQAPPTSGSQPRLLIDGVDKTPRLEPEPHVTIDRLALLTLVPGQKQSANIVLHLACGGQMAKLSATGSDAAPVLSEAETCVSTEGERVPLTEERQHPFSEGEQPSRVGSALHADACPKQTSDGQAICMPAGSFVFGSPLFAPYPYDTTPERFAVMSRYWLDETEVTVGRFRAALTQGFQPPDFSPIPNGGPLDTEKPGDHWAHCTYSATPEPGGEARERFPLNCVSFNTARAFCQFEGGDLPTEAQWQYAATKAGRDAEIDDLCAAAGPDFEDACLGNLANPLSVDDPRLAPDTTPFGVRGLGVNVSEWALDSFYGLDAPCWEAATLTDPVCSEKNPPYRTIVGSDWSANVSVWRRDAASSSGGIQTDFFQVDTGSNNIGFRCAYGQEPR